MTDKLTYHIVEQYAKVLGYILHRRFNDGTSAWRRPKSDNPNGLFILHLDTHFWFSCLWEMLEELCSKPNEDGIVGFTCYVGQSIDGHNKVYSIIPYDNMKLYTTDSNICTALYKAIVILQEQCNNEMCERTMAPTEANTKIEQIQRELITCKCFYNVAIAERNQAWHEIEKCKKDIQKYKEIIESITERVSQRKINGDTLTVTAISLELKGANSD